MHILSSFYIHFLVLMYFLYNCNYYKKYLRINLINQKIIFKTKNKHFHKTM